MSKETEDFIKSRLAFIESCLNGEISTGYTNDFLLQEKRRLEDLLKKQRPVVFVTKHGEELPFPSDSPEQTSGQKSPPSTHTATPDVTLAPDHRQEPKEQKQPAEGEEKLSPQPQQQKGSPANVAEGAEEYKKDGTEPAQEETPPLLHTSPLRHTLQAIAIGGLTGIAAKFAIAKAVTTVAGLGFLGTSVMFSPAFVIGAVTVPVAGALAGLTVTAYNNLRNQQNKQSLWKGFRNGLIVGGIAAAGIGATSLMGVGSLGLLGIMGSGGIVSAVSRVGSTLLNVGWKTKEIFKAVGIGIIVGALSAGLCATAYAYANTYLHPESPAIPEPGVKPEVAPEPGVKPETAPDPGAGKGPEDTTAAPGKRTEVEEQHIPRKRLPRVRAETGNTGYLTEEELKDLKKQFKQIEEAYLQKRAENYTNRALEDAGFDRSKQRAESVLRYHNRLNEIVGRPMFKNGICQPMPK